MKLKTKRKRTKKSADAKPPKSESRPKQNLRNEISGLLLIAAGIILVLAFHKNMVVQDFIMTQLVFVLLLKNSGVWMHHGLLQQEFIVPL